MGPEVFELEARLAEYVGVNEAISCASGTDALLRRFLVLVVVISVYPFLYTVATSFKTGNELFSTSLLPTPYYISQLLIALSVLALSISPWASARLGREAAALEAVVEAPGQLRLVPVDRPPEADSPCGRAGRGPPP